MKYRLLQLKNKLEDIFIYLFRPQHRELAKCVPRNWMDIDGIMEKFLFQCLVSFVEKENGLAQIKLIENDSKLTNKEYNSNWGSKKNYTCYRKVHYVNYLKLQEIYNWYKNTYPEERKWINTIEFPVRRIEEQAKLDRKVTGYLKTIVELKGYLWT